MRSDQLSYGGCLHGDAQQGAPPTFVAGGFVARVTVGRGRGQTGEEGMEGDGGARYACSCTPACVCAYDTIRFDILIPAYI